MTSQGLHSPLPSQIYSRQYYLEVCGGFEEYQGGGIAPRLLQAIDLAAIGPGMRVLDIGCGRGELALMCSELGCEVWAVDYSAEAIDLARDRCLREPATPIAPSPKLLRMNSKFLGMKGGSFDRVFMIDIIEHLHPWELEIALREVGRVLRTGGRLVVHTAPNAWLIKPIYSLVGLLWKWQRHPYHVNEQNYFGLRRILTRAGSRVQVHMAKTPGFFRLGHGPSAMRRATAAQLASVADSVVDFPLIARVIESTPLSIVLGTDLWATADKLAEDQSSGTK